MNSMYFSASVFIASEIVDFADVNEFHVFLDFGIHRDWDSRLLPIGMNSKYLSDSVFNAVDNFTDLFENRERASKSKLILIYEKRMCWESKARNQGWN